MSHPGAWRDNCLFWKTFSKKVPNFDLQLLAETLKKGTKFRLLFGGSLSLSFRSEIDYPRAERETARSLSSENVEL